MNDTVTVEGEGFPIRTVSSLTGVNVVTLRAWERRYGLIRPMRTESGRRLYSSEDIHLIQRVLGLLDQGVSIGQVKAHLVERSEAREAGPWGGACEAMIAAIGRFDEVALNEVYNQALANYSVDIVTDNLILPLLAELGRRWSENEGSVAEEHFFSVYLRNKLGARMHHRPLASNKPRLLLACAAGEQHEVGLLLFALAAEQNDFNPVYLGANTPLDGLAIAAQRAKAKAIVLSVTLADSMQAQLPELAELVSEADVPVYVGGKASVIQHASIVKTGAHPLGEDMRQAMHVIGDAVAG